MMANDKKIKNKKKPSKNQIEVKKLISTLLVFVMLLSAAPLGGFLDFELPEIPWAELFTPKAKKHSFKAKMR